MIKMILNTGFIYCIAITVLILLSIIISYIHTHKNNKKEKYMKSIGYKLHFYLDYDDTERKEWIRTNDDFTDEIIDNSKIEKMSLRKIKKLYKPIIKFGLHYI